DIPGIVSAVGDEAAFIPTRHGVNHSVAAGAVIGHVESVRVRNRWNHPRASLPDRNPLMIVPQLSRVGWRVDHWITEARVNIGWFTRPCCRKPAAVSRGESRARVLSRRRPAMVGRMMASADRMASKPV